MYKNVILELMGIMPDTQLADKFKRIIDSQTSGSSKFSLMVKGREAVIKKEKKLASYFAHLWQAYLKPKTTMHMD